MDNALAKLHKKIVPVGTSYAVRVPKALIDTQVLNAGEEYEIVIRRKEALYGILSRDLKPIPA